MRILVVGATGRIGAPLLIRARERGHIAVSTTRRLDQPLLAFYDLRSPWAGTLPECDVAFLLAGVAGFRQCEANEEAWKVNVDGTITCAKRLMRAGAFVVFTSSVAVEWAGNSQYGRGKTAVETFLQAFGDPAICRFDLQTPQTLPATVDRLLDIGLARQPGIYHL